MTSDPDDAELIARSLDGDEDAFVEVVRRHEAAVSYRPVQHGPRSAAQRDLLPHLLGGAGRHRSRQVQLLNRYQRNQAGRPGCRAARWP